MSCYASDRVGTDLMRRLKQQSDGQVLTLRYGLPYVPSRPEGRIVESGSTYKLTQVKLNRTERDKPL